jgi:hypothetical protein
MSDQNYKPLEIIHSDLQGPMQIMLIGGHCYTCLFTDGAMQYVWVYFLTSKDQMLKTFKAFVKQIEKRSGRKVRIFRSDHGGGFMSSKFNLFLEDQGIT